MMTFLTDYNVEGAVLTANVCIIFLGSFCYGLVSVMGLQSRCSPINKKSVQ
jgi:hypothetical protein